MSSENSGDEDDLTDRFGIGRLTAGLVVAGVGLFLVPEPITSFVGVALLLAGVASWAVGQVGG